LQKQQSTGVAKAVLPPVILLHVHVVVRDPARACETPHVAVCWEHGVVWQLSLYSTQGHIGCVGDGVGTTTTHAGSVNLQCTPGVSTDCGLASKFISKVCRCRKTVSVSPAWPRVLRTTVRNALSCWSTLAFAAAPPSPQPPTASRKQSAKCRLIGLEKVGSSKVSPQQSQTARQSSKSVVVVGEPRSLKKPVQSETAETHLANSLAPAKIPYGPLGSPLHCQFEPTGSSQ